MILSLRSLRIASLKRDLEYLNYRTIRIKVLSYLRNYIYLALLL